MTRLDTRAARGDLTSPFDEGVKRAAARLGPDHDEAIATLNLFRASIQRVLFGSLKNVTAGILPGFQVSDGQQYKVIVHLRSGDSEEQLYVDILVRVYVPFDGYPVTVDMFGGEKRLCDNRSELVAALKSLLKKRDFQLRLKSLETLARHQSKR